MCANMLDCMLGSVQLLVSWHKGHYMQMFVWFVWHMSICGSALAWRILLIFHYPHKLLSNKPCHINICKLWFRFRKLVIDECFSKDSVSEIINSFVSSLSILTSCFEKVHDDITCNSSVTHKIILMILCFSGSTGRQRRKWVDKSSAKGIEEVITNWIDNNTEIGNALL